MQNKDVVLHLKTGLQARTAALFVQEANRYNADIFLEKGKKKVNAKSIMGIMSLAVGEGEEVTLMAEGNDEQEALQSLADFMQKEEL